MTKASKRINLAVHFVGRSTSVAGFSETRQSVRRALASIKDELLEFAGQQLERRQTQTPDLIQTWKRAHWIIESTLIRVSIADASEEKELADSTVLSDLPKSPMEPWGDILEQAADVRYGGGKELQNPEKAQRLFRQAAQLGSGKAWFELGSMILSGEG